MEKELLNLVAKLTKKVISLKTQIKNFQGIQKDENIYYNKYLRVNSENLQLQEKISALETKMSMLNFELEKRNRTLMHAKDLNLKGMEL